jgi:hypothetical protein
VAVEHEVGTRTRAARRSWRRLGSGGTDGNEELTAATGVVLLLMLAALGVTIVRIGQLLDVHMFIGMLLLGPVVLKMASTGYRFVRYYTHNPAYVRKGPPELVLRLIAPLVVLSTVVVFATGVVLLVGGPGLRHPWVMVHKVSFFVWVGFMALHVLGHLPALPQSIRATTRGETGRPWDDYGAGRGARALTLSGSVVLGTVLAIAVIPLFGVWHHGH